MRKRQLQELPFIPAQPETCLFSFSQIPGRPSKPWKSPVLLEPIFVKSRVLARTLTTNRAPPLYLFTFRGPRKISTGLSCY